MLQSLMSKFGLTGNEIDSEQNGDFEEYESSCESEAEEGAAENDGVKKNSVGRQKLVNQEFDVETHQRKRNEVKPKPLPVKKEVEAKEFMKGTGIITKLDESMPKGVIDRQYFFDIVQFCPRNHTFTQMCKVDFEAVKSPTNPTWTVYSMVPHISQKQLDLKDTLRYKTLVVQVTEVLGDSIQVRWEDTHQTIPTTDKKILPCHRILKGDWLKVETQRVYEEEIENPETVQELGYGEALGFITSIVPNEMKVVVGTVTQLGDVQCIDGEIYYDLNAVKGNRILPLQSRVQCRAVSSTQKIGKVSFQWRAIEINPSSFMEYTSDPHNLDEDGFYQDPSDDWSFRFRDLYKDRYGIKIEPRWIKFQPAKLGDTVTNTITIRNTSGTTFVFKSLNLGRDNCVCLLEKDIPEKEKDAIRTIGPDESFTFQIKCTPLQIGFTKELCVFDFVNFKIARELQIRGFAENDDLLQHIRNQNQNSYTGNGYKKNRGEQDILKIRADSNRTRIRGPALVRAPFFAGKRMLYYSVPDEIWEAFRLKDEQILMPKYSGALKLLTKDNYKTKFHVALWYEEVDNDIRRRQYDMANVQLKRRGQNFSFHVPGFQDINPPVLKGDSIDVFDPDEPVQDDTRRIKYQGFITDFKMLKDDITEVFVNFNEQFTVNYTGVPLTIQFCLGRMTYKRQHYAVDSAKDILGDSFLFPQEQYEVKPNRIPFYEADDDDVIPDEERNAKEKEFIGIFGQQHPKPSNVNNIRKSSSTPVGNSKRVQSLRTPFKSTLPTTTFTSDVKLRWVNKSLNEEQRNAVRRILKGQARPLPYIIYGPPGTGKTVTVVEAIIQVNQLDPNSRVLVTAPTNHAADVIAEYLVYSKLFHPGDFVRFNGFMRQSNDDLLDSIKAFCVDGEFLDSVARHRLIVCTCATAGQLFSLNLPPGHFTHVFVDEAGYCTEPEAMIAAINLNLKTGGQLILAGDPNQLGPVLMSDVSKNLKLDVSFLERLMIGEQGIMNVYRRDVDNPRHQENHGYNPLVLTKLVKNYRAHKALLSLPSTLFYNGDLESHATDAEDLVQEPRIIKTILKTQGVPLVFHGVQGNSIRERDSPSWYNAAEVMQVVDYVRKLKQCGVNNEDIGIITPYRKQVEKIRLALQLGLFETEIPKVGSVEEFQGGERKVMIISTVRSVNENKIDAQVYKLGFIFNSKRFNVAITRAKSLLIIIGNPHIHNKDERWKKLLKYCLDLEAYTGCNLPIDIDNNAKKLYKELTAMEQTPVVPTLPPDLPTSNYNPDGLDDFE